MATQESRPSGSHQGKVRITCPCGKQILTSPRSLQLMCPDCGRLLDVPANAPANQSVAPPARPQGSTTKAVVIGTAVGAVIVGLIVACVVLAVLAFRDDEPKPDVLTPIRSLMAKGDVLLVQGSFSEARLSYEEALRLVAEQKVQDPAIADDLTARVTSVDIAQFKAKGDEWRSEGKFAEANAAYEQALELMKQPNILGDSMRDELASRLDSGDRESAGDSQFIPAAGPDSKTGEPGQSGAGGQGQGEGRGTAAGPPKSSTLEERAARMRELLQKRRVSRDRAGDAPGRTTPAASIPAGAGQKDTKQQPHEGPLTAEERKAKGLVLFRGKWVTRQERYRALSEEEALTKRAEKRERKEKEAVEKVRLDAERFEQVQRAKGLVKFREKWVKPEEKERTLREEQTRRQVEAERIRQRAERFRQEQRAKGLVEFQGRWVTKEERDTAIREAKARMKAQQEAAKKAERFRRKQQAKGLVQFRGKWVKPKERDKILKKGAADREAAQERARKAAEKARLAAERFKQEQLAKGLVEFRGRWVTPEQRSKTLRDEEAQKKRRKAEEERRRLQAATKKAEEAQKAKEEKEKKERETERTDGALVPGTPVPKN